MPFVNYAMHPHKEHTVTVDPATSAVSGEGEIPTAELHRAIYEARDDINAILYSQAPEVLAVAAMGKTVKPQLDDSAQIIGVSLKCAKNSPKKVVKALDILADAAVMVLGIIMMVVGWNYATTLGGRGFYVSMPWLSRFWMYFPVPLAGVAMIVFEFASIYNHIKSLFVKEEV